MLMRTASSPTPASTISSLRTHAPARSLPGRCSSGPDAKLPAVTEQPHRRRGPRDPATEGSRRRSPDRPQPTAGAMGLWDAAGGRARMADDELTYLSYLAIPELLSLQRPRSQPPHPEELHFIVVHQALE